MSSDSHQLCPFSKWGLLFKERICSQREQILSFKSSPFWYEKRLLLHYVICLECVQFSVRTCFNANWEPSHFLMLNSTFCLTIPGFSYQSWTSTEGLPAGVPLDDYYSTKLLETLHVVTHLKEEECALTYPLNGTWGTGKSRPLLHIVNP